MLKAKGTTATALNATAGQLMPSAITLSVAASAMSPGTVLRELQRRRRPLVDKAALIAGAPGLELFERISDCKRRASFGAVFVVSMKHQWLVECYAERIAQPL